MTAERVLSSSKVEETCWRLFLVSHYFFWFGAGSNGHEKPKLGNHDRSSWVAKKCLRSQNPSWIEVCLVSMTGLPGERSIWEVMMSSPRKSCIWGMLICSPSLHCFWGVKSPLRLQCVWRVMMDAPWVRWVWDILLSPPRMRRIWEIIASLLERDGSTESGQQSLWKIRRSFLLPFGIGPKGLHLFSHQVSIIFLFLLSQFR